MSDSEQKTDVLPNRLCSEIQLFELCDLCSCSDKNGRFCTNPDLIGRFEKIAEDELRTPERYLSEENDDDTYDDVYDEDDEDGDDDDDWEFEE